jgi:predicted HTH domain antitoxin
MYKIDIPETLIKSIRKIRSYEPIEESILIRQAIEYGIRDIEKELAIKLFSERKTTLSESADIAQLSTGEMMELLAEREIRSKTTLKDYEEGLASVVEML